ncbi:uncharacterized protein (DUF488 family) [Arthrobacter sp. UYCu511]
MRRSGAMPTTCRHQICRGSKRLAQHSTHNDVAIMCAEAMLWWWYHRSLISDALPMRESAVLDIMTEQSAKPHTLTPLDDFLARLDGAAEPNDLTMRSWPIK